MATLSATPVKFEAAAAERDEVKASATRVRFLTVPERRYLAIEGDAPPGGDAFQAAIGALYGTAYPLHFALRERGVRVPIGHLHGVFWFERPDPIPLSLYAEGASAPSPMQWRLLITLPDEASASEIAAAVERMLAKGGADAPVPSVITWDEGQVAQLLHVGPYDAEYPTIERLTTAIRDAGLEPAGCHHEIYLSDPRTPPERTRTVIRQPVTARLES
jgi:hypothetical protein